MILRVLSRTPAVTLLWSEPPLELTVEKRTAFARGDPGGQPVHEYHRWLVAERPVLLHGTSNDVDVFEPGEQTNSEGRPVHAVFASSDGIWPVFLAVVDRSSVRSARNGCLRRGGRAYYWFSLDAGPGGTPAWCEGWVYVLPREPFRRRGVDTEWTSPAPVRPLDRIRVSPDDIPFRARTLRHDASESELRTVLRAMRS